MIGEGVLIEDYMGGVSLQEFKVAFTKVEREDKPTKYYQDVLMTEQEDGSYIFKGLEVGYLTLIDDNKMTLVDFRKELTPSLDRFVAIKYNGDIDKVMTIEYIEHRDMMLVEFCLTRKLLPFKYLLNQWFGAYKNTPDKLYEDNWYMRSGTYWTGKLEEVELTLTEEQMEQVIDLKKAPMNLLDITKVLNND